MPDTIQFRPASNIVNMKREAIKQAKSELKLPQISIDEYVSISGKNHQDASELDLNGDEKISIWEKASETIARKVFKTKEEDITPTVLVDYIYQKLGFAKDEEQYNNKINPGRISYSQANFN